MPAVSKAQQKFMGMVHAAQKGEKPASAKVAKVAKKMKKKSVKDFASTKHKGLAYKVKQEILNKLRELVRQELEENFYDGTKKFEKKRTKDAEVLGYKLTGTPDVKTELSTTKDEERVLKRLGDTLNENIGTEKYDGKDYFWPMEFKHYLRDASPKQRKLIHNAWLKIGVPVKKDGQWAYLEPKSNQKKKAWVVMKKVLGTKDFKYKGTPAESVDESDLGLTYKKGKTITVTHKKSGKEIVIVDKPNVRKEYEKIGFFAEGKVNEMPNFDRGTSGLPRGFIDDYNKIIKKLSKGKGWGALSRSDKKKVWATLGKKYNESVNEARSIKVEPNWEGVWRYFKHIQKTSPGQWSKMKGQFRASWINLQRMADKKGWKTEQKENIAMFEAKFTDDTLVTRLKHWSKQHKGTGIGYGHVLGHLAVHMKEMGWNKSYKEVARIAVELGHKKTVESVNEGKKAHKATYDIFGSLRELIHGIKSLRKMIDDGPYNRMNSSVSGGLYKWEIELEKKLRLFTPQLKKVSADKMLEFINERKLSSQQKKAILIAIEMSGNMTGATKKIEKMKKGLSNDKKVKDALRLANESINEKMGPKQYHQYLQYVFDTQFKTPDEKKMKKSMIKKINKSQKKKGLPIFKEGLGDKFQKNIKKYQDRIEKEREAYKKAREAQKKRNNESVNEVSGVDVAKKVLKNKQMEKGIDLQTANLIVTIDKAYDKNPKLQKKFRKIQLPKMKQLIIKYYG